MPSFSCSIVTPVKEVFDKPVGYVSIPAHDGQMGIAPGHAAFLVRLASGVMTLTLEDGTKEQFLVVGGIAQVEGNKLVVLTDEVFTPGSVDSDDAQRELNETLSAPAAVGELAEIRQRRMERARALLSFSQSS